MTVSKQIKYLDEIIKCFNDLIDKEAKETSLAALLENSKSLEPKQFQEFKKETLEVIQFEDYDRTSTLPELIHTLERKFREVNDKKIMLLEIETTKRIQ